MTPQVAVHIVGEAMMAAFWICAPLLAIAFVVGILVNLIQIATSLQDAVFSTVPRLVAALVAFLLTLPWMLHQATHYAIAILGDLHRYAH
ncbi:MAG: flagellar biosynthetic protein FliQ [Bryobacteraceae bacterium]